MQGFCWTKLLEQTLWLVTDDVDDNPDNDDEVQQEGGAPDGPSS